MTTNPQILAPFGPGPLGGYQGGPAYDAVVGNTLYVADESSSDASSVQLLIYRLVPDPTLPVLVSATNLLAVNAAGMVVQGNTVYFPTYGTTSSGGQLTGQFGSFVAVDVTNPLSPVLSSELFPGTGPLFGDTNQYAAVPVTSQLAYVASTTDTGALPAGQSITQGQGRVLIVNTSDPTNLQLESPVGQLLIPDTERILGIALDGNRALVYGSTAGLNTMGAIQGNITLTVLDTTDPLNPAVLGSTLVTPNTEPSTQHSLHRHPPRRPERRPLRDQRHRPQQRSGDRAGQHQRPEQPGDLHHLDDLRCRCSMAVSGNDLFAASRRRGGGLQPGLSRTQTGGHLRAYTGRADLYLRRRSGRLHGDEITARVRSFLSGALTILLDGNVVATTRQSTGKVDPHHRQFRREYISTAGLSPAGSPYTVSYEYAGDTHVAAAQTVTTELTVNPATPAITWAQPADIAAGTELDETQLDAQASVPGTYVYSSPAHAVLPVGQGQTLSVEFTPTDAIDYTTASASTTINVLAPIPTPTFQVAPTQAVTYGTPSITVSGTITAGQAIPPGSVTVGLGSQSVSAAIDPTSGRFSRRRAEAADAEAFPGHPTRSRTCTAASPNFNGALGETFLTVNQAKPTVTWANPADITDESALDATELDATASVAGTFTYDPPKGTQLSDGQSQVLSVTFTPTDSVDYTTASGSVTINVTKPPPAPTPTPPLHVHANFPTPPPTPTAHAATAATRQETPWVRIRRRV